MNKKHYEIQYNQCTPFDEGVAIEGNVGHIGLDQIMRNTFSFKEFVAHEEADKEWWLMMEISVWEEIFPDEWDREYLGCFYIDKRFKEHGLVPDDYDNEYITNVPKYVAKALQKWMRT